MTVRIRMGLVAAVLALAAGSATATTPVPTVDAGARQVLEHKVAAYRDVLSAFDQALRDAPDDASIAVDRCRFIGLYIDDEYGEWVESAPDQFDACRARLAERWPDAPVARLFELQQLWGESAAEMGEELLEHADDWPRPLRQALLAKVSEAQEYSDNEPRAGELAVQAVQLGDASRVARAVRYLVSRGEFAEAERLLAGTGPAAGRWAAQQRVEAALDLPDRQAALRELARYSGAEWSIDADVAARAHLQAGNLAKARALLAGEEGTHETLRQLRFDAAMAAADIPAAVATLDFTDAENVWLNMQRFMILAKHSPSAVLQGPMLVGVILVLMLGLVLALLPGLLLVPVHYRGLVRRVRGRPAVPMFEAVGLHRAWWAAAMMLTVPTLVAMVVEPTAISHLLDGEPLQGPAAFRVMFWGSLAGFLCLLPAIRGIGRDRLLGDRASMRAASWRVPVALVGLLATGFVIANWHGQFGGGGETLQTRTIDALTSVGSETYGPLATLLLLAVLVPIFEELVFRGLLLGGLTRHISFGWANLAQSTFFALAHDDAPRFVFYLTLGLLGGWLVKRTNALAPAIALHALNNALVFALVAQGS